VATTLGRTTSRSPVQASHNCTENNLEDSICRQRLTVVRASGVPSRCINHIANALLSEVIVQLSKSLCRTKLVSDLEELNSNLVRGCLDLVELLSVMHEDTLRVIGGTAVGDDDDVDRLGRVKVTRAARDVRNVWFENAVKTRSRGCRTAGTNRLEQLLDLAGVANLEVSARGLGAGTDSGGAVVQEVNVDTVWVVRRAERGDGAEGIADFSPRATGHGTRIVDDKDGIEGGEESILVFGAGDAGDARSWRCAAGVKKGACLLCGLISRRCLVRSIEKGVFAAMARGCI
jgi:hypothetical protein